MKNGVVVFDVPVVLPEGTKVNVVPVVNEHLPPDSTNDVWAAATQAAQSLPESGYDFDAWQQQREFDRSHSAEL